VVVRRYPASVTDTPGPEGVDTSGTAPVGAAVDPPVRLTAHVRGEVQGVGFRWWVRSRALALGLSGRASNLADGRVEVVAEGPRAAVEELLAALRDSAVARRPGRVTGVGERVTAARGGLTGFVER
jgi:acylphosphatase